MTSNLKWYMVFSALWSLPFFAVLHWALFDQQNRWQYILVAALAYGIGFAIVGALLGGHDSQAKTRYNLSLLYGLTSNSISFFIGALWILLFRGSHWWELIAAGMFMVVSVCLQLLANRGRIKGMNKGELFK